MQFLCWNILKSLFHLLNFLSFSSFHSDLKNWRKKLVAQFILSWNTKIIISLKFFHYILTIVTIFKNFSVQKYNKKPSILAPPKLHSFQILMHRVSSKGLRIHLSPKLPICISIYIDSLWYYIFLNEIYLDLTNYLHKLLSS